LCLYFGGRVAETIIFNRLTTSSESDLKYITELAYKTIQTFGMNDSVGHISFPTQQEIRNSGEGFVGIRPFSKRFANTIDFEVNKLVTRAFLHTKDTITEHLNDLCNLSEELIKKESLNYQEIVKIIGEPINKDKKYQNASKFSNFQF
jgi:spastic paraplegia 7